MQNMRTNHQLLVTFALVGLLSWAGRVEQLGAQDSPKPASLNSEAVFSDFSDWVSAAAFSPDSKTLAIGTYDSIRLVDVEKLEFKATTPTDAGFAASLAYTPDGKVLAAGCYQSALIIDKSGVVQKVLKQHRGQVTSVCFSKDGTRLLTGCDDEAIRIWDWKKGTCLQTIKAFEMPVQAARFSPDGQLICVATGDPDRPTRKGKVHLLKADGKPAHELEDHKTATTDVVFTEDGKLLSASTDKTANVYDTVSGKPLGFYGGHVRQVNAIETRNGYAISVSGGGAKGKNELRIWKIEDGEAVVALEPHEAKVTDIALSPDGKLIATASQDKTLALWKAPKFLQSKAIETGSPNTSSKAKRASKPAKAGEAAKTDKLGAAEKAAMKSTAVKAAVAKNAVAKNAVAKNAVAKNDVATDVASKVLKVGIIGLDTSHATAFTKMLNAKSPEAGLKNCRVVAAYPKGSPDIKSSVDRVPKYTAAVKELGVEIVDSIDDLLTKVDCVLLETNDGRPHLEQIIPCLRAGKPVFIDKPIAGSLSDAIAIFDAAKHFKVPVFSSSSLRFSAGAQKIRAGEFGKVLGADAYSPCKLEATHPDLFWYGIHGVETLFTVLGPGCQSVVRSSNETHEIVVGQWKDAGIGTFRGLKKGKSGYGGTVFTEKGVYPIGGYDGYKPLLIQIVAFFNSGEVPIADSETLEIYAFMEAADVSKRAGGTPVRLADVMQKAREKAAKTLKSLGIE